MRALADVVMSRGPFLARMGMRRGHGVVGLLLLALALVLIVLGVVAIVTLLRNQRRHSAVSGTDQWPGALGAHDDPVLVELRLRYARGEIGRDEFMQRAADLGYRPRPGDTNVRPPTGSSALP